MGLLPGFRVDSMKFHEGEDIGEFVPDAGADLVVRDASPPVPFIRQSLQFFAGNSLNFYRLYPTIGFHTTSYNSLSYRRHTTDFWQENSFAKMVV
jgi:hypothetical protein